MKRNYNYAINGLRGLCILMIFFFHIEHSGLLPDSNISNPLYGALRHFVDSFKYGVEIFFMISGYVIIASLRRHKTLIGFFRDRVLRIYPTWVPLHILSFIGGPIIARGIFETYNPELWTLSFFTNLFFLTPVLPFPTVHPPTWSLCYEWFFYFSAAAFTFFLLKNKTVIKYSGLTALILIILLLFNFFPRSIFFLPGVFLAIYKEPLKNYDTYFCLPFISLLIFLLSWKATGIEYAEIAVKGAQLVDLMSDERIIFLVMALLSGTYSFACIVFGKGYLSHILCAPVMQFFGNISYAFYLWSPVAFMIMKIITAKFVISFSGLWPAIIFFMVTSLILSTVISWLNWYFIEKKFTSFVKRSWLDKDEPARKFS